MSPTFAVIYLKVLRTRESDASRLFAGVGKVRGRVRTGRGGVG